MRTSSLILAAALSVNSTVALAQGPWGKVKSWTGTVTIEATDTRTGTGRPGSASTTLTYKATGPFTITDDAMPDGDHVQWPMPGPESMTDAAKLEAAYKGWQAKVVATYVVKGLDEAGTPHTLTCNMDLQVREAVGVAAVPMTEEYTFSVTAPSGQFKCSDGTTPQYLGTNQITMSAYVMNGPRGQPGQVTNTKTYTRESTTIKVTFTMAPAK